MNPRPWMRPEQQVCFSRKQDGGATREFPMPLITLLHQVFGRWHPSSPRYQNACRKWYVRPAVTSGIASQLAAAASVDSF